MAEEGVDNVDPVAYPQRDLDSRVVGEELLEQGRQDVLTGGGDSRQAQVAGAAADLADGALGAIDSAQDDRRVLGQPCPAGGQPDAPAVALHEGGAKVLLEGRRFGRRDRGLGSRKRAAAARRTEPVRLTSRRVLNWPKVCKRWVIV